MPSARPRSSTSGGGVGRGGFEGIVDPATRRALLDLRKQVGVVDAGGGGLAAAIEKLPKGIVAWKAGNLTTQALTVTPVNLYSIAPTLVAGRQYEVVWNARAMVAGAGPLRFVGTSSPTVAQWEFDVWALAAVQHDNIERSKLFTVPTSGAYTLRITAAVSAGTGSIWTDGGCAIWIKDIGLPIAALP